MRFLRVGPAGLERPVVLTDDDRYFELRPLTRELDGDFLAADGVGRTAEALRAGDLPETDIGGERIGAPIARPQALLCIGMNFAAHAAESGALPPENPVVFLKTPNTVVGPNDDVILPRGSTRTDWEVELAVVIGRRARYLDSPADAPRVIAGYTLSNDVSERTFQLDVSGGQWSKGKCCETFNPMGPWLATPDYVGDAGKLGMRSWVNGDERQNSNTVDMVFGIDELVWHLSQYMVLEPGYVINTGTPQGVALSGRFPYLKAGDVMRLEIDRLGRQEQRLVAAS